MAIKAAMLNSAGAEAINDMMRRRIPRAWRNKRKIRTTRNTRKIRAIAGLMRNVNAGKRLRMIPPRDAITTTISKIFHMSLKKYRRYAISFKIHSKV